MATSRKVDHGKIFEREVHDAFRHLPAEYPILWERVLDSHDAGNIVRKADCDFKLTYRSPGALPREGACRAIPMFIECKASVNYNSFNDGGALRQLIKSDQIAKMRMARRVGVFCYFWFHAVNTGIVEVWEAEPVIEGWGQKRTKFEHSPALTFHISKIEPWALALVQQLTGVTR